MVLPKFVRSRQQEEFLSLARAANHPYPRSLEQRAFPAIAQGKDVLIETGTKGDAGDLPLLPLFLRELRAEAGVATLIVAATAESVRRLGRRFRALTSARAGAPNIALIGIDENIRKELQLLSKPLDAVIATPERLIDHIRRDNLKLSSVKRVVIEFPPDYADTGFDKDILFVYSKLGHDVQTVATIPEISEGSPVTSLLRHPHIAKAAAFERPRCRAYRVASEQQRVDVLADLFFAERLSDMLVLCGGASAARSVSERLLANGVASRFAVQSGARSGENEEIAQEVASGKLEAVVADSYEPAAELPRFSALVYAGPSADGSAFAKACEHLASKAGPPRIFVLYSREEEPILKKFEEVQNVEMSSTPSGDEVLKGRVTAILKRARENEDPAELKRYQQIIRRAVPMTLRGSFAAFLLKESLKGQGAAPATGDMKTLFVSIGKNRRVFPRDLSRLFSTALQVKPTSIGAIKVLDNYSFVDVPQDLAERAIELLDAKDFRGRKITVNHARKRDDAT